MKITVSRHELFSHHLEEEIELDEDLIEDVLEWSSGADIEDYNDFFAVLPEYFREHDIDDPNIAQKIGTGEYYPGNSDEGHDWNHVVLSELTDADRAMIMEAIARFNE